MKKKNLLFNGLMVAAIAIICFSAIMLTGNTLGWFTESKMTAERAVGQVTLTRNKIASTLTSGDGLQNGDVIEVGSGGAATLVLSDEIRVFLNERTSVRLQEGKNKDEKVVVLEEGNLFCQLDGENSSNSSFSVLNGERAIKALGTVFEISAASDVVTVNVFEGATELNAAGVTQTVAAGERGTILSNPAGKDEISIGVLTADSLAEFVIDRALAASTKRSLFFTEKELQTVLAKREAEILIAQAEAALHETTTPDSSQPADKDKKLPTESKPAGSSTSAGKSDNTGSKTGSGTANPGTSGQEKPKDTNPKNSEQEQPQGTNPGSDEQQPAPAPAPEPAPPPAEEPPAPPALSCSISIRCDTILDNMADLAPGKEKFVPSNGVIVGTTKVKFEQGETVFDVLQRITKSRGIHMAHKYFPAYKSVYIQGINQLYEFDCGPESGWMYKVNGVFPNYGCSVYELKDGDVIVWAYTSKGLGKDLGTSF